MTPEEARAVVRPAIEVGGSYTFYSEMQEEYLPASERMRRFTGQKVVVIEAVQPTCEEESLTFTVQAADGSRFTAMEEEMNGWDYDLGQFFWPNATYGPNHETWALTNEKE